MFPVVSRSDVHTDFDFSRPFFFACPIGGVEVNLSSTVIPYNFHIFSVLSSYPTTDAILINLI